ncbi:MAG: multiubiquitin domain-containing protein [Paludibacter sp.]|nr:multiubiquitin domain-containing protein [Paludibacter sp.]
MKQDYQNNEDHVLHLIINEKNYKWEQQYITGAQVRQLGNIPQSDKLFLAIKRPWEDEPIMDDTKIDLARPGIEKFYSAHVDEFKPITIIVNGRPKEWNERKISYEEVVKLAFPNAVENEATVYTVTYANGPKQNEENSMVKGDVVFVKNQMVFNVTATNRS